MEEQKNATISEEEQQPSKSNSPAEPDGDQYDDNLEKGDSKADSVLLKEGHIEERFKIDRKKLEKLIQGE